MKLVPININEAIKHLQGKSLDELDLPEKVIELLKFFNKEKITYVFTTGKNTYWIDFQKFSIVYSENTFTLYKDIKPLIETVYVEKLKEFLKNLNLAKNNE